MMSSYLIALHPSEELSRLPGKHRSTYQLDVTPQLSVDNHLMVRLDVAVGREMLLLGVLSGTIRGASDDVSNHYFPRLVIYN